MNETIALITECAVKWAQEVGAKQLTYFRNRDLIIDTKSNVYDVVTQADKESEAYLINRVSARFPDHSVMGEESGMHFREGDFCWIIDPLDGTNNFSQGLPVFCVSIGVQYQGQTVVGVVYAPYLRELYVAVKGQGATLNGSPIRVGDKTSYDRSVLATGFPYDKDVNPDNNLDRVTRILPKVRGIRRFGSAAYDLCCVAAGYLDGYWEITLHEWDVCAGTLIVEEAGGVVEPFRSDRKIAIVAGNRCLVDLLLSDLK